MNFSFHGPYLKGGKKKYHSVIFIKIKIFRSITFLEYYPNPLQSFMGGSGIFLGPNFISSTAILRVTGTFFFLYLKGSKESPGISSHPHSLDIQMLQTCFSSLSHCLFTPGNGMREQHTSSDRVKNTTQYTVTPPKILHNLLQGWHCLIAFRWRYCTSNVTLSWGAQLPVALQD